MSQECRVCKENLPYTAFRLAAKSLRKKCKKCENKQTKEAKKKARADMSVDDAMKATPKPTACSNPNCNVPSHALEFKWRSDMVKGGWRSECNDCYNSKKYYEKHRQKRKATEGIDEYRRKNAKQHKEWADRNPDKVKAQKDLNETNPTRKFKSLITYAKQKEIFVELDEADAMMVKFSMSCHYCDFCPEPGEHLNGLDRLDNKQAYTDANTVPCCSACNYMKGAQTVDEFVTHVRRMHKHNIEKTLHDAGPSTRKRLLSLGGYKDMREADNEKESQLSEDEKIELWSNPCYLCGHGPSFGIDRVDSSGQYTIDNVKPCCTTCNYMKKHIALHDFLEHVNYIWYHTSHWIIRDIMKNNVIVASTGSIRQPVAMTPLDGKMIKMVFPSIGTAARMNKVSHDRMNAVLDNNKQARGMRWIRIDPEHFRKWTCDAASAKAVLQQLRGEAVDIDDNSI